MGNSTLLWKILIVKIRIKNEIIDKVDHNSVQISCKNKGQMVASVHSFIRSLRSLIHSLQQPLTFFLKKSTDCGSQLP